MYRIEKIPSFLCLRHAWFIRAKSFSAFNFHLRLGVCLSRTSKNLKDIETLKCVRTVILEQNYI